ncbi:hypothetical protein Efla_007224 [Eimeria flavescens]
MSLCPTEIHQVETPQERYPKPTTLQQQGREAKVPQLQVGGAIWTEALKECKDFGDVFKAAVEMLDQETTLELLAVFQNTPMAYCICSFMPSEEFAFPICSSAGKICCISTTVILQQAMWGPPRPMILSPEFATGRVCVDRGANGKGAYDAVTGAAHVHAIG